MIIANHAKRDYRLYAGGTEIARADSYDALLKLSAILKNPKFVNAILSLAFSGDTLKSIDEVINMEE